MTRGAFAEYNFTVSPYTFTVPDTDIKFVFSSQLHQDKFEERYLENRSVISESLSNRFKIDISADIVADISLYYKIEQRGFLIIAEGVEYHCLSNIKLGGVTLMKRN